MVQLKFLGVKENGKYILRNEETGKFVELFFQFFFMEKPENSDVISLDEKLLDKCFPGFAQPYSWAPAKEDFSLLKETERATLTTKKETILLKRMHG